MLHILCTRRIFFVLVYFILGDKNYVPALISHRWADIIALYHVCVTRHNSADSVPTSNLVCIEEVTIRTTFSHMINIAGTIYDTCSLVIDIQCSRYKNAFNKRF